MRQPPPPPRLEIAAGVLLRGNRVLVQRRARGTHLAGRWEFPGGKVEPGESSEAALRREIREELGIGFGRAVLLHRESHRDRERTVDVAFWLCLDPAGEPRATEGQPLRWVELDALGELPVPPANRRVVARLAEQRPGGPGVSSG